MIPLIRHFILLQLLVIILSICIAMVSGSYIKPLREQAILTQQIATLSQQLAQLQSLNPQDIAKQIRRQPLSPNIESLIVQTVDQYWLFSNNGVRLKPSNNPDTKLITIVQPILISAYKNQRPKLSVNAKLNKQWDKDIFIAGFFILSVINLFLMLLINRRIKDETQGIQYFLSPVLNADARTFSAQKKYYLLSALHSYLATAIKPQGNNSAELADNDLDNIADQQELMLARKSAAKANRLKNQIIANTSHELLTPLNSIVGFSELLLQKEIKTKQSNEFIHLINDNALYLSSLVNDLVLFSENGSADITLNYTKTDIYSLLNSIAATLATEAQKKQLQFILDITQIKGLSLDIDAVRLRQIINNLLVNAIRHTEQGSVSLTASISHNGSYKQYLTISVTDTGCGMSKPQQHNIFDAFITSQDSLSNTTQSLGLGLGLGLAIVQKLAARMGASIELQSEVLKGTAFKVTFPARNVQSIANEKTDSTKKPTTSSSLQHAILQHTISSNLKTLVVDDNSSNAMLLKSLLNALFSDDSGCQVDVAYTGQEALALLTSSEYDWIFLDIRMQPMNGIELLHKLKALPRNQATPVIACTAHTSEDEFRQLIETGFERVIHKPISTKILTELYQQIQPGKPILKNLTQTKLVTTALSQTNKTSYFDPALALERAAGNRDVAYNIFLLLLKELQFCITEKKLRTSNQQQLIDHVHQLNGAAAISAVSELKARLNNLEQQLKSPEVAPSQLTTQVAELESYINEFIIFFKTKEMSDIFNVN